MKEIILYLEKETGVTNLGQMTWKEIVDTVVFPEMAGPRETRWCISDQFMNFVAKFAGKIRNQDFHLATAIFEVALQRLSCGAITHDATPWPEPLPKEYWDYSSKWDEAHVLTKGCYNFIMNAIEYCLLNYVTRSHALEILFGIQAGKIWDDDSPKSVDLVNHSTALLLKYATFDEMYSHFARPAQWMKHKAWFANNFSQIDWKKFFEDTKCARGNFFQRWRKCRSVKSELKKMSLPVAK